MHCSIHTALIPAGPLNPNTAETIFAALKANAGTTAFLAKVHPSYQISGVRVKDLRAANNPTLQSTGAAAVGASASTQLPTDVACVVTLRTAQSGRGFVGRIYVPGLAADQLSDSRHWLNTPAFDTIMTGFANAINAAATPSMGSWVIGQRALKANPDPAAPPPYNTARPANTIPIVAAAMADHRVDSQRKRLGRT